MGCTASAPTAELSAPEETGNRKSVRPRKKTKAGIRLVLIGQGESGKSTIFKQMKIIQAKEEGKTDTFSEDERKGSKLIVYSSAVTQMQLLLQVAFNEEMELSTKEVEQVARKFLNTPLEDQDLSSKEMADTLRTLWSEPALKLIYGERDRLFNINDGAGYFWDALDRIYAPDYAPTDADMLRIRLRTLGMDEATFTYKKTAFHVLDMGGQRSERRNWEAAMAEASCFLFVCSLTEWDQTLREDFTQPRMRESLHLFTEIMQSQYSQSKATVVLLNKLDLYKLKMQDDALRTHFVRFFTDYKGVVEELACLEYIKQQFIAAAQKADRRITLHAITAVETDNVRLVWQDIRNLVLQSMVESSMNIDSL